MKNQDEQKKTKLFIIHILFVNQAAKTIRHYLFYGYVSVTFEIFVLKFFEGKIQFDQFNPLDTDVKENKVFRLELF